ncbi:GNAT family N-acetyltransferase [Roseateles koreensis]|uniref:GNAT family N-acetyltransferase n=1 Tax=Roseateles koreensis TaxID=2987526 RepID=A0ABT5KU18_9BURK|nr:GNAT family N-acetyltransferase [Roseateles koreensis]MDC8786316.1 GNAT family N-acetyltransferase [Roseateles koreensis]
MAEKRRYIATVVDTLDEVDENDWQRLAGTNPFVSYQFLKLLQTAGCATGATGWHPSFLLLHEGEELVGVAPAYLKTHSRGEFVFDQAWAQAFEQHGLRYYPKILVAAPFTPVQGPRLLAKDEDARRALAEALAALCNAAQGSSVHVLFTEPQDQAALVEAGFMLREGVQFHWENDAYGTTEDFLAKLSHDKRKKIRQDSKYVAAAGLTYRCLEGDELQREHLEFFYACYVNTYQEHWSRPYLSFEFFLRAHEERILHFVLILAERGSQPMAVALNVRAGDSLYGRHWGALEFVKGIHFETCYMQSIAYCIREGLKYFEGGAQGEHKMSRGLMPVKTYSAHWVADRQFAVAIEDFLHRETQAVDGYVDQLAKASPFKRVE